MPSMPAMPDRSLAWEYHDRTKYDPETLAAKSRPLDWNHQPSPYKDYALGAKIDLKPYLVSEFKDPTQVWWWRLARLLICSYGLTARQPESEFFLRAAPSAGGLYPGEIYLLSRGTPDFPAGIYDYQVRTHSLLRFWDGEVWPRLQAACFWHPSLEDTQVAIVISAVFFRSAWRYQDRAYRRIGLDLGHILGNLNLAGSLTQFRPHLIGGFDDAAVNELLYFEPEREGTMVVAALADRLDRPQNLPPAPTALASPLGRERPSRLRDGQLLAALHEAASLSSQDEPTPTYNRAAGSPPTSPTPDHDKYNFPFCLKIPAHIEPIAWGKERQELDQAILRRRSTRAYSGAAIEATDLFAVLHFAYQPQDYAAQGIDPTPDFFDLGAIETFVVVTDVRGLEAGCYYYAPRRQELRQIRFNDFREDLHFLCLGQDLGRDAAAIVVQTASLETAIARWGDRAYRYLHLDSGHLGQRLNLAAVRLGLGVSGIAGFFDDLVNEVLGIPTSEAVLYLTTLGQPQNSGGETNDESEAS